MAGTALRYSLAVVYEKFQSTWDTGHAKQLKTDRVVTKFDVDLAAYTRLHGHSNPFSKTLKRGDPYVAKLHLEGLSLK